MDKKFADLLKEALTAGRAQGTVNKEGVGSGIGRRLSPRKSQSFVLVR